MAKGPVKTADQAAANWAAAMASATTASKYKAGISAYNGNPMADAATPDAEQRYISGVQNAVSSGRRQNALNSASAADWKNNALQYGPTGLANAASKKKAKAMAAYQKLQSVWAQMRSAVQGMPKGGYANATARANAALQILMQSTGKA